MSTTTTREAAACPTKLLGGNGDRFRGHTVASEKSDPACTCEYLRRELKNAIERWKENVSLS